MEIIDNINRLLGDDLKQTLRPGARLKVAASCFSMYAYEALKAELEKIEELSFIFTAPAFVANEVTDKIRKERREFHIPKLDRERSLYGSEFEIQLRNKLTQRAIAKECADWLQRKATTQICDHIASVYQENAPESIYFLMLYNIFNEFLDDIDEDVLPNDRTGYQETLIWNKLFNYQKDAATGIINKLETYSGCIRDMYVGQARRYFPMPDYDLGEPSAVKMTLYGGVVDIAYSRLLIQKTDLPLTDVLVLDRVQKKLPIPEEVAAHLRKAGLIEGRKPNYFVSAMVAAATANKADYIRTRAQDDEFYAKLLTDYLEKFGEASRTEVNKLLLGKLSDALTEEQKYNKVGYLLTKLRRRGDIVNSGSDRVPCWKLAEKN